MNIKERYDRVLTWFSVNVPVAETELTWIDPFQLIVAVILSAQCTDKRVNLITPALFGRFPDADSMAMASLEDIFECIKSCSYPNNKTRHIKGMAEMIVSRFSGAVPSDINDLMLLPGVGRKTANVIASVVWNRPVIAVDTHVFRVAKRLGLTPGAKSPLEVELQLTRHIPESKRPMAHHWLLLHGRYTCTARNPACIKCGLSEWCVYFKKLTAGNS
ncbi:MAG TPA: endonuclease III [Bacteroidales bacterium]|nr:endonuclease III [Bacteroidales bacterium]